MNELKNFLEKFWIDGDSSRQIISSTHFRKKHLFTLFILKLSPILEVFFCSFTYHQIHTSMLNSSKSKTRVISAFFLDLLLTTDSHFHIFPQISWIEWRKCRTKIYFCHQVLAVWRSLISISLSKIKMDKIFIIASKIHF